MGYLSRKSLVLTAKCRQIVVYCLMPLLMCAFLCIRALRIGLRKAMIGYMHQAPGLCQGQGLVVCGVACCRMLCCIMRLAAQRRSDRKVFDCCQCQYPCGGSSFLGGFGCLCFFFFGGFGGLWLTCLGCGPCGGRVVTHDVVPKPMNSAIVAIIIVFLMVKVFVS